MSAQSTQSSTPEAAPTTPLPSPSTTHVVVKKGAGAGTELRSTVKSS